VTECTIVASIRTTPEGTFQVLYRDPAGRQRSKTFKRKTDANRFTSTVQTDILRGDWLDPHLARMSVREWSERWSVTMTQGPKTRELYKGHLKNWVVPMLGDVAVANIDKAMVRGFAAEIRALGKSQGTVDGCLKVLRLVLGFAVDAGAIKVNPAVRLNLERQQRREMYFLTESEVVLLASQMRTPTYESLVLFAAWTGMRAGEIEALRVKRVNLAIAKVDVAESLGEADDGTLRIGPTKTYQRRTVPLAPFLVERLGPMVAGKDADDFVFTAPAGGAVRHHNFYGRAFKPGVKSAGLDGSIRFHDLRHTCAAWLIDSGAHVRAIMEWLGHSSPTVTLGTYGHLFPSLSERLVDGLEERWQALKI
jgi:integrase